MTVLGKVLDVLERARRLKTERQACAELNAETVLLSESALAKDWLDPAEDAAWGDL